jgi:hypothetical protein
METYVIINTKTNEIFSQQGTSITEFATFHQARQTRINLNDASKRRIGIPGANGSQIIERTTHWQIFFSGQHQHRTKSFEVNRPTGHGAFIKAKETKFIAIGELGKSIVRAPSSAPRANNKQQAAIGRLERETQSLAAELKTLNGRIAIIEGKAEGASEEHKARFQKRLLELNMRAIKLKVELNTKRSELLTALARRRTSNSNAPQSSLPVAQTVIRRKTS